MTRWTISLDGGPRRVNHAAVAIGKHIYSFGGYCSGEHQEVRKLLDVHVLDTTNYRWKKLEKANEFCSAHLLAETDSVNIDDYLQGPVTHRDETPYQRYGHTVVEYGGKAYLWGGRNDDFGASNVLHSFDPENRRWERIDVTGFVPAARDGHTAVVVENKMVLFGGFEEDAQRFSQETFIFDFDTRKWSELKTTGTPPLWRDFHTAAAIDGVMYVFGGRSDQNGQVGDDELFHSSRDTYDDKLMALDLKTAHWRVVKASGKTPLGRRSHSAWVYNGKMFIFGGYLGTRNRHFNELYCFDPKTNEWDIIEAFGTYPSPRRRHCSVVVDNRVFLFGGTSPSNRCYRNFNNVMSNFSSLQSGLSDLSDMHVLDYSPSLFQLSATEVLKRNLPNTNIYECLKDELPFDVRLNLYCMTEPNQLNQQTTHRAEIAG
ncbi:unnamed protein product [Caenorhabditis bovis]|uniref:Kelch domain-containing protein 3 n=1 Tax=Caenorhabditis bovis TaxID=2654633 RepID=A0A8S1EH94_9PELO|nr:unnamed protein product [Caenorhabditis bovis]